MMERFARFLISGGIAAVLNWSSRFLFSIWFPFEVAVVLSFFVGLSSAFFLMHRFVFEEATRPLSHQMGWFFVVNMAALAQTLLVTFALAWWLLPTMGVGNPEREAIAHLFGIVVPVATSYIGHSLLSFR